MSIIEEFEVVAFKYIAFGRGQWELSRRYPEGTTILIESNTAHLPGATSL